MFGGHVKQNPMNFGKSLNVSIDRNRAKYNPSVNKNKETQSRIKKRLEEMNADCEAFWSP